MKPIKKVALIGNPNCGKSTLFNALTGSNQKVGNWPGVTVERKSGHFRENGYLVEVVDLPGVYSLVAPATDTALDVRIACEAIASGEMDMVVNILDASNLERHLYLTTQLLEMQVPVVVAVNMLDVAERRQLQIDLALLSKQLGGCPVVGLSAFQKIGIQQLKKVISTSQQNSPSPIHYPAALKETTASVTQTLTQHLSTSIQKAHFLALRWLEHAHVFSAAELSPTVLGAMQEQRQILEHTLGEETDVLMADARYTAAHQIAQNVSHKMSQVITHTLTQRIDNIVLHRIWGIPIFLAAMYVLFFFSISIGSAFQPFFNQTSASIFVDGFAQLLHWLHMPETITVLLTLGIGTGITTVVTFIPVIGFMFLGLSLLESSGYMARAAFVIDRVMRALGLPGKSFVPLIVGFGCNVPSILGARTLEHRRDRLLTLMMSPFMSCSARLAIYAVFVAAFFPSNGSNIVFMLYMIGIVMAVMTGFLLRKTMLKGESSPWLVELPAYHVPTPSVLFRATWHRLKMFVLKAGRYIIPVCFLLGGLNAFTVNGNLVSQPDKNNTDSILSVAGKIVTPVFTPMGIQQENWPATVGLVSGVLAKEVVVGTLNTLYAQAENMPADAEEPFDFLASIKEAFLSIPEVLGGLKNKVSNPITGSAADAEINVPVLGAMARYFDGQAGAMAYLLFVLLYFPCISATAALARESSKNWAIFSVLWTTGLAYVVAVIFYQAATWVKHPLSSAGWIVGLSVLWGSVLWGIKWYADSVKFSLPVKT